MVASSARNIYIYIYREKSAVETTRLARSRSPMNEPVIELVQLVRMEIHDAARSVVREFGYAKLKSEQLDVVEAFVKGRDVFALLPTGYGKSLCFGCLPLVLDKPLEKEGEDKSIAVL